MRVSNALLTYMRCATGVRQCRHLNRPTHTPSSFVNASQQIRTRLIRRKYATQPADQPGFTSIVDQPARTVSSRKKHTPFLIVLALIPITAFGLGTWQVQRLQWKTELITRFEDRLIRDPLPLPPTIDTAVIPEFDYRRVYATGTFRHDQEILVGPRVHEGEDGFQVFTPMERGKEGCKIIVGRGWISKKMQNQAERPEGLPRGQITVEGLLREPWKKNMFTPDNDPAKGKFYFPDVEQMASLTGSEAVLMEATMEPDYLASLTKEAKGIPIGRPGEVNLRNNHTQYIFTWYALCLATTVMFAMVIRRPQAAIAQRVNRSKEF